MGYNQNSGYGQALLNAIHAAIPTFGRVFIVMDADSTDEENYQKMQEVFKPYAGVIRFYTTVAAAYAATESNNNDVIVLDGSDTHPLTSMLTVSNNRVHFVGLDWLLGVKRPYGCSSKISIGVTTAATDLGAFLVTGVRCSFRGIKVISDNTVDEGLYGFLDGGEYTYMEDCEVYKSTDMDETGAAELVANGDSSYYKNCTFGSLATARSGAVIRPNVLVTNGLAASGKVARDVTFDNCNFWINASDTANRFVYGANAADVERLMLFDNCKFINNGASASVPAQNVAFGATLTVGDVLLRNCSALNAATAMSTTTGVFVDGSVPAAATTGIAVQAS